MIERYDREFDDMIPDSDGEYCRFEEIAPLLAPPWKVECHNCDSKGVFDDEIGQQCSLLDGLCPVCEGRKFLPVYYTTTEWRQWYLDNGLPDPGEWVGPVWRCGNMVHVPRWWFMPNRADPQLRVLEICAYGNVPCPPDDYRHGGE